jgi:hypothetical protein
MFLCSLWLCSLQVLQVAENLLDKLQLAMKGKSEDEQCVGSSFVDLADQMKYVYGQYCMNHNNALILLEKVIVEHTTIHNTIFKHPAALYCSMGFAGYVSFCVQLYCILVCTVFHYMFRPTWPSSGVSELYCVGFNCLSLHVSACMAIFKCVGALLCCFQLSFTTCFGLHGHLQVCRSFIVLVSTVFHYMFRPAWPSSGVSELYCVGFNCIPLHVSACMAIFRCVGALLCWFQLSFATCFGLHGHLQVCRSFIVLVSTVSLHVSAYMAIFRCVRAILFWFSLSFTTCLGLHGHLQVCRSFIVLVSTVFHCMFRPIWLSSGM